MGETLCTIILASNMAYQKSMLNHIEDFINSDCSDPLTLREMK